MLAVLACCALGSPLPIPRGPIDRPRATDLFGVRGQRGRVGSGRRVAAGGGGGGTADGGRWNVPAECTELARPL